MDDHADVAAWRTALRSALTTAMKARDTVATGAIRSVLGAIDNAEAADIASAPAAVDATIAGGVVGLGAGDVDRRQLSTVEVRSIVTGEAVSRIEAAKEYEHLGQSGRAGLLRAEAAVINGLVPTR